MNNPSSDFKYYGELPNPASGSDLQKTITLRPVNTLFVFTPQKKTPSPQPTKQSLK